MNRLNLIMTIIAAIIGLVLLIVVVGQKLLTPESPAAGEPLPDKLTAVLQRGTLIVSTDPAYPLQSDLLEGARRAALSDCRADHYTAAELGGFDIDVAVEIATRLGVEACFVTPEWESVVGGGWNDQWDISIGSVAITQERLAVLLFTQPYYTTPAVFFVHQDNSTDRRPGDLMGKTIGVCHQCSYEAYLNGSLRLPGQPLEFVVKDAIITTYATDAMALHDLALGDGTPLDAVLTAQSTGQAWISVGQPLKQVGEPVFVEYLAAAVDRHAPSDPIPLVKRVSQIIEAMHRDGTLRTLSQKYYGRDLTTAAARFDLESLTQFP
jgi:polar amino acid transport system substrate-binding protein